MSVINWLQRLAQSRGFGVQSPFAFSLVRDVIRNPLNYYAYKLLDDNVTPLKVKKELRLLFRLANYIQPELAFVPSDFLLSVKPYIEAGCRKTEVREFEKIQFTLERMGDGPMMMISEIDCLEMDFFQMIKEQMTDNSLLIVKNIDKVGNRERWQTIQMSKDTGVTFDLGNLGLVFWNHDYYKQNYQLYYV